MATTLVEKLVNVNGELREVYADVDGPASYLADGAVLTAAELGLRQIHHASAGASDNGDQFCAVAHLTKGPVTSVLVQWYVNTTGAEVANAVNLSARFVRVRVTGR